MLSKSGSNPPARTTPRGDGRISRRREVAGQTHAERLRAELADDIVYGRIAPGTQLDETSLAARFGVSRTPVREALRELAASGLVVHKAHRGAVVTEPSDAKLKEMFAVMAQLEAFAAGLCAVEMTPGERTRLVQIHAEALDLVQRGDLDGYTEANDTFHDFLYEASHNAFLADLCFSVRRRVSAFRRAQFHTLGRLKISHAEHDAVIQSILRGDAETAAAAMRNHIDSVHHAFTVFHDGIDDDGDAPR